MWESKTDNVTTNATLAHTMKNINYRKFTGDSAHSQVGPAISGKATWGSRGSSNFARKKSDLGG